MRYLPAAHAELISAAEYYESKEPGLGLRFLDVVEAGVGRIIDHPLASPVSMLPGVKVAVRQHRVPPFPDKIVYVLEPEPLIVAIAHSRRAPGYWANRLPSP